MLDIILQQGASGSSNTLDVFCNVFVMFFVIRLNFIFISMIFISFFVGLDGKEGKERREGCWNRNRLIDTPLICGFNVTYHTFKCWRSV